MPSHIPERRISSFISLVGAVVLAAFAVAGIALVIFAPTSDAGSPTAAATSHPAPIAAQRSSAPASTSSESDGAKAIREFTESLPERDDLFLAKSNLRELLRDPESAEFEEVIEYRTANDGLHPGQGYAYCGKVNAKTIFGGYAGFQRFIAAPGKALLEYQAAPQIADGWTQLFERRWAKLCGPFGTPVTFSLKSS